MFRSSINRVHILSFLFCLHVAIATYVNSTFLAGFFSEKSLGLLYTVASVITLFLLSESSKFLSKIGNRELALSLVYINMMALYGLAYAKTASLVAVFFVLFFITNGMVFYCIDIFIEHFGNNKKVGKNRAVYLTLLNVAWLVSPLLSASVITRGGYGALYIFSFYIALFVAIIFIFSIKKYADKKYTHAPFFKTYEFLKSNRHIFSITMISFLLQFFFAIMVIYMPLYLHQHLHFAWTQISIIFSVMLLPFVLFGLPIGILIDKFHVSKRMLLSIGLLITALSTLFLASVHEKTVLYFAIILFMTRVGAVLIETTSEIYFFTHVREEDAHLLSVFRDMSPLAYVVGPLFGTAFLFFFPLQYIFMALGIIMLFGFFYIRHLRHSHMPNHLYSPNDTNQ